MCILINIVCVICCGVFEVFYLFGIGRELLRNKFMVCLCYDL